MGGQGRGQIDRWIDGLVTLGDLGAARITIYRSFLWDKLQPGTGSGDLLAFSQLGKIDYTGSTELCCWSRLGKLKTVKNLEEKYRSSRSHRLDRPSWYSDRH